MSPKLEERIMTSEKRFEQLNSSMSKPSETDPSGACSSLVETELVQVLILKGVIVVAVFPGTLSISMLNDSKVSFPPQKSVNKVAMFALQLLSAKHQHHQVSVFFLILF